MTVVEFERLAVLLQHEGKTVTFIEHNPTAYSAHFTPCSEWGKLRISYAMLINPHKPSMGVKVYAAINPENRDYLESVHPKIGKFTTDPEEVVACVHIIQNLWYNVQAIE